MYYVYYLKSLVNNDLYIGSTQNLKNRIKLHNNGKVKSTKPYKPWELLGYEEYNTRSDAFKREVFLKTHQQKELIKIRFGLVAKG